GPPVAMPEAGRRRRGGCSRLAAVSGRSWRRGREPMSRRSRNAVLLGQLLSCETGVTVKVRWDRSAVRDRRWWHVCWADGPTAELLDRYGLAALPGAVAGANVVPL